MNLIVTTGDEMKDGPLVRHKTRSLPRAKSVPTLSSPNPSTTREAVNNWLRPYSIGEKLKALRLRKKPRPDRGKPRRRGRLRRLSPVWVNRPWVNRPWSTRLGQPVSLKIRLSSADLSRSHSSAILRLRSRIRTIRSSSEPRVGILGTTGSAAMRQPHRVFVKLLYSTLIQSRSSAWAL